MDRNRKGTTMSSIADGHFNHLYQTWQNIDQKNMSDAFRMTFNDEADAGGFTRGSKNLIVVGPNANYDCYCAFACLNRGEYHVALMDVRTIIRRLDSKWIPRWTPDDDAILDRAECLIVIGLFNPETIEAMTPSEIADLTWFLTDCINNGVMLLVPTNNQEADANVLGDTFGELLEQNTEVDNGTATKTFNNKTGGNKQHGGDETAGKRRGKHKRKNTS